MGTENTEEDEEYQPDQTNIGEEGNELDTSSTSKKIPRKVGQRKSLSHYLNGKRKT